MSPSSARGSGCTASTRGTSPVTGQPGRKRCQTTLTTANTRSVPVVRIAEACRVPGQRRGVVVRGVSRMQRNERYRHPFWSSKSRPGRVSSELFGEGQEPDGGHSGLPPKATSRAAHPFAREVGGPIRRELDRTQETGRESAVPDLDMSVRGRPVRDASLPRRRDCVVSPR